MAKFNFINAITNNNSIYGKDDIKSEKLEESKEKIDVYKAGDLTDILDKNSNDEVKNNAFNLKNIAREKIKFNSNNDFEITGIEELAKSLLDNGMLHNFIAIYDSDEDIYYLESGERRLRACDYLYNTYDNTENKDSREYELYLEHIKDFYINGFPINIKKYQDNKKNEENIIDSELRKYSANLDVRNFTPQDRLKYINRIKELLQRKQELSGVKSDKSHKEEITNILGISNKQYAKYEAVNELIPALKMEFEEGNLAINKIPSISKLSVEEQEALLELIKTRQNIEVEKVARELGDKMEKLEKDKSTVEEERLNLLASKSILEKEFGKLKEEYQKEKDTMAENFENREKEIKEKLEKAIFEDNREQVQKLQDELVKEKNIQTEILLANEKQLKEYQEKLDVMNLKMKELEESRNKDRNITRLGQLKGSIEINMSFLRNLYEKISIDLKEIEELSSEEAFEIKNQIKEMNNNIL